MKGLFRENNICLRSLANRNRFYGISLIHNQTHPSFVLVKIGKKVSQSALSVWVCSCSDTIDSDKYSRMFGNSKFKKKCASVNYVPYV